MKFKAAISVLKFVSLGLKWLFSMGKFVEDVLCVLNKFYLELRSIEKE